MTNDEKNDEWTDKDYEWNDEYYVCRDKQTEEYYGWANVYYK